MMLLPTLTLLLPVTTVAEPAVRRLAESAASSRRYADFPTQHRCNTLHCDKEGRIYRTPGIETVCTAEVRHFCARTKDIEECNGSDCASCACVAANNPAFQGANDVVPDYVMPDWLTGSMQSQLVRELQDRLGGSVDLVPCYDQEFKWGSGKRWQRDCGHKGPTLTLMRVAKNWDKVQYARAQPAKKQREQHKAQPGRVVGAFADKPFKCRGQHALAAGGGGPSTCWLPSAGSFLFRFTSFEEHSSYLQVAKPRYPLTGYNLFGSDQFGPCLGYDLHVGFGGFGGRVLLADVQDDEAAGADGVAPPPAGSTGIGSGGVDDASFGSNKVCTSDKASISVHCAHYGRGIPDYDNRWLTGATDFLTDYFITYRVVAH